MILPPGTRVIIGKPSETVLNGETVTFYSADAKIPEVVSTMEELEAVTEELKADYCDECGEYAPDGLESACIC